MSEMVTIVRYGFADIPRIAILKSRLEAEGVIVHQSDEFGSYKRRISSFHLDIPSSQLEMAIPILEEYGYYREGEPFVIESVYHWTSRIPLLRMIAPELRVFVLIVLVSLVITTILIAILI